MSKLLVLLLVFAISILLFHGPVCEYELANFCPITLHAPNFIKIILLGNIARFHLWQNIEAVRTVELGHRSHPRIIASVTPHPFNNI